MRPPPPDPCYLHPARRRSLMALFDDGFPGLSPRIEAARAAGFVWEDVTWPFVAWEGDEAVAHVGVLAHRVRLDGADTVTAGVHAVVTRSDRRRRGLARRLLSEALTFADEGFAVAKLSTDVPEVYAPHGFVALPLHTFRLDHQGGEGRGRPLAAEERGRFLELCAARDPVSHRFASLDPGWLVGTDLALQRRTLAHLVALDELGAVVDWSVEGTTLHLHDVFARELPPLVDLLRLAPAHRDVALHFCPDRLAPGAVPVHEPDYGVLMVRGAWPLPLDLPLGQSRLAEH